MAVIEWILGGLIHWSHPFTAHTATAEPGRGTPPGRALLYLAGHSTSHSASRMGKMGHQPHIRSLLSGSCVLSVLGLPCPQGSYLASTMQALGMETCSILMILSAPCKQEAPQEDG